MGSIITPSLNKQDSLGIAKGGSNVEEIELLI